MSENDTAKVTEFYIFPRCVLSPACTGYINALPHETLVALNSHLLHVLYRYLAGQECLTALESLTALDADTSRIAREVERPVFCLIVSRAGEVLNDIPYWLSLQELPTCYLPPFGFPGQAADVKRTTCMICDRSIIHNPARDKSLVVYILLSCWAAPSLPKIWQRYKAVRSR